jgi:hypothetical protein
METLIVIYDASWSVPSFILIFVYIWLLVQIWKGNRNRWLLWVTGMLFSSLFGSIIKGYALYMLTFSENKSVVNCWEVGIGDIFCFGVFVGWIGIVSRF